MKLQKINGTYTCFYKGADGKTKQVDTKQTNLPDAKEVVAQANIEKIEKAAIAGLLNNKVLDSLMVRDKSTNAEVFDSWLQQLDDRGRSGTTTSSYAYTVEAWLRESKLWDKRPQSIKIHHVDDYVNPDSDIVESTRKARLSSIKGYCGYCRDFDYVNKDPSSGVVVKVRDLSHRQREGKRRVPFTENEFTQLINYLDVFLLSPTPRVSVQNATFWQAAIPIAYWTGLRLSDICTLEKDSFTGDELIVHTRKADYRVALPLDEPLLGDGTLRQVLQDIDSNHDRFYFPHHRAIQLDPKGRSLLSKDFARWVERAGLKKAKTFHCLRHSCATRLKRAGKTLEEIGEIIGHKDTRTTQGYTHP